LEGVSRFPRGWLTRPESGEDRPMNGKTYILFGATLLALWIDVSPALAQYPNLYEQTPYRYGTRARLSPYLNLVRTVNGINDPGIDYYLGTVPERERRFNASVFNTRIRNLEQQEILPPSPIEEIAPVPTAGKPIGARTSDSYFRQDGAGARNITRSRRALR
jgi:hypothetical protein